ncbi:MAG: hypothetical protein ACREF3_20330, partial [Acetobacteraceae bacterium]
DVPPTGTVDAATWQVLHTLPEPCPGIDTRAVTFIAQAEISSRTYYDQACARPTWPGAESGITIGIGYDLRFADAFQADWGKLLIAADITALDPWCGKPGTPAAAAGLRAVVVPWNAAWTVFTGISLPFFVQQTRAAFPGFDALPPLCRGALVSLVYNRGPSMDGPRRTDMRAIRDAVQAGNFPLVPGLLRAMKRLWPDSPGLQARREAEAGLFEQGLREAAVA